MLFRSDCPQREVAFAPGTTWVVFSDQVLHAVMSGQFMMEQTFWLSPADQQHVFSAFHRSTNPNALSIPGTGLGLPIAARIPMSRAVDAMQMVIDRKAVGVVALEP